ncbi:MAG: hypothetical protein LBC02_05850 [Planctomycetaceae bacterium]|jgi:hypothetical protein|nr:hypothetical protein [Planctomycetaceae bacterium]
MWHTPLGTKTFSGTFALMLARGILELIDRIQESLDEEDEYDEFRVGHRAFDCLTLEQKIWTIHKVTFGLLDKKTPACELSAFLEAVVASIFNLLEDGVMLEIDDIHVFDDDDPEKKSDNSYDRFYWRKIVFAPYCELIEEGNKEITEEEDKINLVDLDSEAEDDWELVLNVLKSEVLGEADYDLEELEDCDPDSSDLLKQLHNIKNTYFSSIPHDPERPKAIALLKETKKFCNGIVRREEKLLKK